MFLLKSKSKPSGTPRKRKSYEAHLPKVMVSKQRPTAAPEEVKEGGRDTKKVKAELLTMQGYNVTMKETKQ